MLSIGLKFMTLTFRICDLIRHRMDVLLESGTESGFCLLDYGYLCHDCDFYQAKLTLHPRNCLRSGHVMI